MLTPFRISFEDTPSWWNVIIDFYLNLIFIIDIIITFMTPIFDKEGKMVHDRKKIAIKYFRTWFFPDVLLCFPLSYFRITSRPIYGKDE
jgi:hypothetical protein